MKKFHTFRAAKSLTEFLQAPWVIIYDEVDPKTIRKQGSGKEIKENAIQSVLEKSKTYQKAEQRIEQRLVHLMKKQLVFIAIAATDTREIRTEIAAGAMPIIEVATKEPTVTR
ncbi:MAG: hypothetical protein AAF632_18605 [Bacteroidota bacterium]